MNPLRTLYRRLCQLFFIEDTTVRGKRWYDYREIGKPKTK